MCNINEILRHKKTEAFATVSEERLQYFLDSGSTLTQAPTLNSVYYSV